MAEINEDFMLSTFDNAFNPFNDFETWWKEDLRLGHNSCVLLAREANTSSIFTEDMNHDLEQKAIDRIVKKFPMIYRKVLPSDYEEQRND